MQAARLWYVQQDVDQREEDRLRRKLRDVPPPAQYCRSNSSQAEYYKTGVSSPNKDVIGALRALPVFAHNLLGGGSKKDTGPGEASCTKHQYASGALSPGVLV